MSRRAAVAGYMGVVVLMSAGAATGLAGSNTVFSDDIVNGQVAYADIRDNAMTGKKILNGSLTGADVNEATLAPTCAAGMSKHGDVCFSDVRPSAFYGAAFADCSDERLRLPTVSEAVLMTQVTPVGDGMVWSDAQYSDDGVFKVLAVRQDSVIHALAASAQYQYRCVTTIGARP